MHMMSKKDLSSEECWTVKRSRTPTVVLTDNGEVHTYGAQVFVHDLTQFVTVQLLEETSAVLWPGKLCKDHGYSCEWVSGQEPRLTQNGKKCYVQDRQFCTSCRSRDVSILQAVRLLQRHHKNRCDQPCLWKQGCSELIFRFSIRGEVDEQATRRLGQEPLRSDKKDEKDPLADMPFWLKDFTDNLKPTEVHAPAHISQDSDRHSNFIHFPKDRNCDVCLRTKITKNLMQETHWRSSTASRKVW